jgi:hypothetical protein
MFALRTLRELKLLKYFAAEDVSENVSFGAHNIIIGLQLMK